MFSCVVIYASFQAKHGDVYLKLNSRVGIKWGTNSVKHSQCNMRMCFSRNQIYAIRHVFTHCTLDATTRNRRTDCTRLQSRTLNPSQNGERTQISERVWQTYTVLYTSVSKRSCFYSIFFVTFLTIPNCVYRKFMHVIPKCVRYTALLGGLHWGKLHSILRGRICTMTRNDVVLFCKHINSCSPLNLFRGDNFAQKVFRLCSSAIAWV